MVELPQPNINTWHSCLGGNCGCGACGGGACDDGRALDFGEDGEAYRDEEKEEDVVREVVFAVVFAVDRGLNMYNRG